ncbi:hypothetical protein BH23PAT2_BH23PAT2_08370 [soil metagenome]
MKTIQINVPDKFDIDNILTRVKANLPVGVKAWVKRPKKEKP